MSDTVIRVENLSKQYRLGNVGAGSISHDMNRFWYRVRGREDPYLMIAEENDRTKKSNQEYIWALKDINFSVERGDVIGIIGKNGAGKSTLLKILSRTTSPTTGSVKLKGRVASLLEVGTGFHPELTGRENIFLNGAILGMNKQEIKQKFDEIVNFSGVERYIDTPVKRYSSGMYVRLAFSVAAHLDPDILIVDEVLAVGDAEFQKKCLGKMDIEASKGRTILFVSHNLQALQQLCPRSILLNKGKLQNFALSSDLVREYLAYENEPNSGEWYISDQPNPDRFYSKYFSPKSFYIVDIDGNNIDYTLNCETEYIYLIVEGVIETLDSRLSIGFVLRDYNNNVIISNKHTDMYATELVTLKIGWNKLKVKIRIDQLNEGVYYLDYNSGLWGIKMINSGEENRISIKFKISGLRGNRAYLNKKRNSILSPYIKWDNE